MRGKQVLKTQKIPHMRWGALWKAQDKIRTECAQIKQRSIPLHDKVMIFLFADFFNILSGIQNFFVYIR